MKRDHNTPVIQKKKVELSTLQKQYKPMIKRDHVANNLRHYDGKRLWTWAIPAEWSGLMAKVTWQMVWEILELYKGQTKSVTAMEIVKMFNQNEPTSAAELRDYRNVVDREHWMLWPASLPINCSFRDSEKSFSLYKLRSYPLRDDGIGFAVHFSEDSFNEVFFGFGYKLKSPLRHQSIRLLL
jgi:hypothetical protein